MKIMVIGSGGREHALCWKISRSPLVTELFCTPGNPGIAEVATCLQGDAVELALQHHIDFVVVGPDGALADGIVDRLAAVNIPAFGPTQSAARLESSKIFCKGLLHKYNIPTAESHAFASAAAAREHLLSNPDGPIVVKADGLAVGKGVVVAANRQEALQAIDEVLGIASSTVAADEGHLLLEEMMTGEEVSFFALTDGKNLLPLTDLQDHKRVGEGDTGPNTGGMGAYSPVPTFTAELRQQVLDTILMPTLKALQAEGIEYRGVLYLGLMLTPQGPRVVEYNARFGDPETQVIVARLKSDIVPLLLASAGVDGFDLTAMEPLWSPSSGMVVVMAASGYPGSCHRGQEITGLLEAVAAGGLVFHAGTASNGRQLSTNGGRVLGVVATGQDLEAAAQATYSALDCIHFEGAQHRRDIGWRHRGPSS